MINLFANQELNNRKWGYIGANPDNVIKINTMLTKLGIRAIVENQYSPNTRRFEDCIFEDLTLYLSPVITDENTSYYSNTTGPSLVICEIFKDATNRGSYRITPSFPEKMIPLTINHKGTDYVMAVYVPNLNMLAVQFNMFNHDKTDGSVPLQIVEWFVKELKNAKIKLKRIDTTKARQDILINRFHNQISEGLRRKKESVGSIENDLNGYKERVVEFYRLLDETRAELKSLEELNNLNLQTLKKQVNLIKNLPFVKKVDFVSDSINVELGRISIPWDGMKVYMGDYTLKIQPKKIKVVNKHVPQGTTREHFNADGSGNLCTGTAQTKVEELLGTLKLKELVFLMYSLLNSYNPNDYRISMVAWKRLRAEEGKFDGEGNPLQPKKEEMQTKIEVKKDEGNETSN